MEDYDNQVFIRMLLKVFKFLDPRWSNVSWSFTRAKFVQQFLV
jgi:hypothetical protein